VLDIFFIIIGSRYFEGDVLAFNIGEEFIFIKNLLMHDMI